MNTTTKKVFGAVSALALAVTLSACSSDKATTPEKNDKQSVATTPSVEKSAQESAKKAQEQAQATQPQANTNQAPKSNSTYTAPKSNPAPQANTGGSNANAGNSGGNTNNWEGSTAGINPTPINGGKDTRWNIDPNTFNDVPDDMCLEFNPDGSAYWVKCW